MFLNKSVEETKKIIKQFRESADPKKRLEILQGVKDSIELVHTSDYGNFLEQVFPLLHLLLDKETEPQFTSGDHNVYQKMRMLALEILNRLPSTDVLRPYVKELLPLVMRVLMADNEENAIICTRIIFDAHKSYAPNTENQVQLFIQFFINLYRNLHRTLNGVFKTNASGKAEEPKHGKLMKSTESFKVLTECPLVVMLLFQLYPKYVEQNIRNLIPLMIMALTLRQPLNLTPAQMPPLMRSTYVDFIAAQVKTLSFLTYVLRGFADSMLDHQQPLSESIVQLLKNCPGDATNSRKELLVATRHVLATDFRRGFFSEIDTFLCEEVLVGDGSSFQEMIRPLAYTTLADLIHHARSELTMPQFSRVIYIFSRNIHDSTLPLSIQTASVRLVLNLVDHIFRKNTGQHASRKVGRQLLVRILHTLVQKFSTLRHYIPKLLDLARAKHERIKNGADTWSQAYAPRTEKDFPEDSIAEVRTLMYTIIYGLKTVVWCVSNFDNTHKGLEPEECDMLAMFFEQGLECFAVYSESVPLVSHDVVPKNDSKDVLEQFASLFTVLEHRGFRDVISMKMDVLFKHLVENTKLNMIVIPQHFLSSTSVSKSFADILLSFLTKRMSDMAQPIDQSSKATNMLSMFRIVFGSVTLFAENEAVLRPYLIAIVSEGMKLAMKVEHPLNYFSLLRALFRSIGGGKFEQLYKEFLPLLPQLLSGLMQMQKRGPAEIREISVELCLTVPARLSSLLPYIPLLMQAVVLALKAQDVQVIKLGLRTLEFWVDYLKPEYLYPHMEAVLSDLMRSLCALLKPSPSTFGNTALSVLGKLGGRNRRFLIENFSANCRQHAEDGCTVDVSFLHIDKMFRVPMDEGVRMCSAMVREQAKLECRRKFHRLDRRYWLRLLTRRHHHHHQKNRVH